METGAVIREAGMGTRAVIREAVTGTEAAAIREAVTETGAVIREAVTETEAAVTWEAVEQEDVIQEAVPNPRLILRSRPSQPAGVPIKMHIRMIINTIKRTWMKKKAA